MNSAAAPSAIPSATPPDPQSAVALDDAFAAIMEALCRGIAAQGVKGWVKASVVVLLWSRMRRLAADFLALAARARNGTLRTYPSRIAATRRPPFPSSAPPEAQGAQGAAPGAAPPRGPVGLRLARGFAWLLQLVPEAASCGSQLGHLLTRPEMAALVAASPQAARLLRPLCRALGVDPATYLPAAMKRRTPRRAATAAVHRSALSPLSASSTLSAASPATCAERESISPPGGPPPDISPPGTSPPRASRRLAAGLPPPAVGACRQAARSGERRQRGKLPAVMFPARPRAAPA